MEPAATSADSEMASVGGGEIGANNIATDRIDLKEVLVVLDKWTRTCDMILNSIDDQVRKISKSIVSKNMK